MAETLSLWKHRYRKFFHLIAVYRAYFQSYWHFKSLKKKLEPQQKLILISLSQHFGDIVAAEPLSEQIRAKHPNDYIVWILKPAFAEILNENPFIDKTISEFCANHRRLLMKAGLFDKVYNLMLHRNSSCSTCGVFVENENQELTPENYYNFGNILSIQQTLAGLPLVDKTPKVYIKSENISKVDQLNLPKSFVVIHAQSNEPSRNWDIEKWKLLIDFMKKQYPETDVIEIGLKSELGIKTDNYINLCGILSLLDTAEVIKRAKIYIGIDSGPAHFANAVGTNGILLLGKWANFDYHQPYSGNYKNGINCTIIRTQKPTSEIKLEEVTNQIDKIFKIQE